MKKVLFILLAAAVSMFACKKSQNSMPDQGNNPAQITDADFTGSKATVSGLHFKKNGDGLEMDYDLVIKEVSTNKYVAAVKIKGLTLDGKDVKVSDDQAFSGIVLTINNLKSVPGKPYTTYLQLARNSSPELEKWAPLQLAADIKIVEKGRIYTFPEFSCEDDLTYEVLKTKLAVTHDNPFFLAPQDVHNNVLSYSSLKITVPRTTSYQLSVYTIASPGTLLSINGSNTTVAFSIELTDKGLLTFANDQDYFVLPSGHTIKQDPEITKMKIEEHKGVYGYVTIIVTGDIAGEVPSFTYRPESSKSDTKDSVNLPVMRFLPTHHNQAQGIRRFESTKTWAEVFGKEEPPRELTGKGKYLAVYCP